MASVSYEEIRNSFFGNVTDYKLASQDINVTAELTTEYIHKSVSSPYIRRLFATVSLDDPSETITYTLNNVVDEESDNEFLIHLLGKACVYEWIHPRVRDTSLLAQAFAGKESKFYSQAAHLQELQSIESDCLAEVRKMIADRGVVWNKYLLGGT